MLVYFEETPNINSAIQREKQIKEWEDLSEDWV
jgi:predicted GIY-YIG superfamily endonuclease